jgi:hypothetical protein
MNQTKSLRATVFLRQPIAPRNIWKKFSNFRTLQSTGTMLSVARLKLHALA